MKNSKIYKVLTFFIQYQSRTVRHSINYLFYFPTLATH